MLQLIPFVINSFRDMQMEIPIHTKLKAIHAIKVSLRMGFDLLLTESTDNLGSNKPLHLFENLEESVIVDVIILHNEYIIKVIYQNHYNLITHQNLSLDALVNLRRCTNHYMSSLSSDDLVSLSISCDDVN